MKITYTYIVNGYNLKNNAVSVTYTPADKSLNLNPYTIQQLGVDLDDAEKVITQIVLASSAAQTEWNNILAAKDKVISPEIEAMVGQLTVPSIPEAGETI